MAARPPLNEKTSLTEQVSPYSSRPLFRMSRIGACPSWFICVTSGKSHNELCQSFATVLIGKNILVRKWASPEFCVRNISGSWLQILKR